MRRNLLLAVHLIAAPLAAGAEPWSCNFTAECHAGLACDATDWDVEIIAADHEGQLFASSIAGDTPVTRLAPLAYAAPGLLVTIHDDNTATLSSHGDVILTYFGTCEVLE